MEPVWALGLMSGTSLDGVDVAWLRTDGHKIFETGKGIVVPYTTQLREKIRSILGQKMKTPEIEDVERDLTLFHVDVVKQALSNIKAKHSIDVIGFHGHTIYHAPPVTWQIGDGRRLAQDTGIDVIYDFRGMDVAHGGQGAPLAPIFHQAIAKGEQPEAILNVGGVGNLTWIHQGHPLIAFDTGPGGALLDDWVLQNADLPYDKHGQLSAQGKFNELIIQKWMMHPYFSLSAPKSLDRNDFANCLKDLEGCSIIDGAATLVEFSARSIVHGLSQMPIPPQKLYVTGGGRHNKHLMHRLTTLAPCSVNTIEALDWDGDLLEAYLIAYLAARVKAGLPTSYPTTTGVKEPVSGGKSAFPFIERSAI